MRAGMIRLAGIGRGQLGLLPALLFLGLFYLLPLANLVAQSFRGPGGPGFDQYLRILATPVFREAWRNSLMFAGASALIAVAGGLMLAQWTTRRGPRLRAALLAVYALPYTMSGLVVAFGFVVLTGRNGLVNQLWALIAGGEGGLVTLRSWGGLLAVFPFYNVPLAALILTPLIEKLGQDLAEAAALCGAGRFATWRLVILPALRPGMVAAGSLVFAAMMGAFGTTLAITGFSKNLLSLQIYSQSSESGYDLPLAAALAVVLMASTIIVLALLSLIERRQR